MRDKLYGSRIRGRVRAAQVKPGQHPSSWIYNQDWQANLVMDEWGAIVTRLLVQHGSTYKIGGMYFEFENTGDPEVPIEVPVYGREAAAGVAYYDALATSFDRDYLSVPLISGIVDSADLERFPNGNRVTFFAQTTGTTGVHGKPFDKAHNSIVFGGALVAFPVAGDPTQDIVFSRFYLDPSKQQPKLDSGQIGFSWELELN